eukprot:SM000085S23272  [mRNA]  locus=s85:459863:472570:+ [translate_table: standard]
MARRALLAGCNYPGTQVELKGCVNDVMAMRTLLLRRFGFSPDDVVVMIDTDRSYPQPTGANIRSALAKIARGTAPGDVVLFHFSGHGTEIPQESGMPDDDGREQCIVPTDMNLLTDDDFRDIVNSVPDGVKFIVIADSCHSGGLIDHEKEQLGGARAAAAAGAGGGGLQGLIGMFSSVLGKKDLDNDGDSGSRDIPEGLVTRAATSALSRNVASITGTTTTTERKAMKVEARAEYAGCGYGAGREEDYGREGNFNGGGNRYEASGGLPPYGTGGGRFEVRGGDAYGRPPPPRPGEYGDGGGGYGQGPAFFGPPPGPYGGQEYDRPPPPPQAYGGRSKEYGGMPPREQGGPPFNYGSGEQRRHHYHGEYNASEGGDAGVFQPGPGPSVGGDFLAGGPQRPPPYGAGPYQGPGADNSGGYGGGGHGGGYGGDGPQPAYPPGRPGQYGPGVGQGQAPSGYGGYGGNSGGGAPQHAKKAIPLDMLMQILSQRSGQDVGVGNIRTSLFQMFGDDASPMVKTFVKVLAQYAGSHFGGSSSGIGAGGGGGSSGGLFGMVEGAALSYLKQQLANSATVAGGVTGGGGGYGGGGGQGGPSFNFGGNVQPQMAYAGWRPPGATVRGDMGILISGCQHNETSADADPAGNPRQAYGALSHSIQTILSQQGQVTFRQLVVGARQMLHQQGFTQNPGLFCIMLTMSSCKRQPTDQIWRVVVTPVQGDAEDLCFGDHRFEIGGNNGADAGRRDASWAHVAELEEELQDLRRRLQKTEDDASEVQPVHLAVKEDASECEQLPGSTEADGNDAEKIANVGKGTVDDGGGRGVRTDGEARVAVRDRRRRRRSWSSEGHETSFYGWLHEDGEEDESPISKSMAVDKPGTGAMSQDLVRGPGDDNVVAPAAPLADPVNNADAPDAAGHHLNLSLNASVEDIPLAADQQQGATEASAAVEDEEEEGGELMLVLDTAELRRSWASPSRDWLTGVEHAGPGTAADTDEAGAVDELPPEAAIACAADVPEESAEAESDEGKNDKPLQVEPAKSEAADGSGSSGGSGGSGAKGVASAAAAPHLTLVPLWDLEDDYDAMVAMDDAEHGGNGRASVQALAVDSLPEADMLLPAPPTSPRQKLGAWLSSLKRNASFGRGPPPPPPTAPLIGPDVPEDNTSDGAHQPGPADAQPAEAPQPSTVLPSSAEAPERPLPRRLPQRLAFLRSAARREGGRSPVAIAGSGGGTMAASAGEKLAQAGDADPAQSKGASLAVSIMDAGAVFGEGPTPAAVAGAAMAGNNKENEQAEEEEDWPVPPPRPPSPSQQPFRQAASVPPSEENIVMTSVTLPPPLSELFSVRDAEFDDARKVDGIDDAGGDGGFKALRRSTSLPRWSSDNDDGARRPSMAAPADALPLARHHSLPRARLKAWESTQRLRSSESPSQPAHAPARHESPTHAAMLASVGRSNLPIAAAVVANDRSSSPGGERVLRVRLRERASDGPALNLPPWGSPLARSQSVQRSPPPRSRSLVALKPTAALRISSAADDNGLMQNLRQSSSLPRTWRSPSAGRASDREQSLLVRAAAAHWLPPHVGGSDEAFGSPSQRSLRAPLPPGIPNSTNKYSEDQTVRWHHTPFEERVERAVSRQEEAHSRRQLFKESRLALKASEHDDLPKRTYLVTGRLSLPSMREAKILITELSAFCGVLPWVGRCR